MIILNGRIYSCPFGDLLPPLDNDEDIDLHQNIEAHGVLTPVLVTDRDEVIDGHNRL